MGNSGALIFSFLCKSHNLQSIWEKGAWYSIQKIFEDYGTIMFFSYQQEAFPT